MPINRRTLWHRFKSLKASTIQSFFSMLKTCINSYPRVVTQMTWILSRTSKTPTKSSTRIQQVSSHSIVSVVPKEACCRTKMEQPMASWTLQATISFQIVKIKWRQSRPWPRISILIEKNLRIVIATRIIAAIEALPIPKARATDQSSPKQRLQSLRVAQALRPVGSKTCSQ